MKILILEGDRFNAQMLRRTLEDIGRPFEVSDAVSSLDEAVGYLTTHNDLDLLIASTQLSDSHVFKALESAPDDLPVLFLTGYDPHDVKAFEYNDLPYLVKPVDSQTLSDSILKSVHLISGNDNSSLYSRMTKKTVFRERFVVKSNTGERVIPASTIRFIYSENKYTYLCLSGGENVLIDMSLDTIAKQMNPKRYIRANRKFIIPIDQVEGFEKAINGKELLLLKGDDAPQVTVSRDKRLKVRRWAETRRL